jgi:hypothetical protein
MMTPTLATSKNVWSQPKHIGYVALFNILGQQNSNFDDNQAPSWAMAIKRCRCVEWCSHLITPQIEKKIVEIVDASLTINIVLGVNYKFVGPQNSPTFHEHVIQGHHTIMGEKPPTFIHLSTHLRGNYLLTWII